VVIENRDAVQVMRAHDGPQTLHFVDPPYVHSTRRRGNPHDREYAHEMTDEDHVALATALHSLSGMVVLCGYPSALYDELYGSWAQVAREAFADGARRRTECLWLNPAAASVVPQPDLFTTAAS